MMVNEICEKKYNKPLSGCTNEEIYYALLDMTKDLAAKKESEAGKKKVYYISAEFLIGKLLSNNLINLGLYKTVKKELEATGRFSEKVVTVLSSVDIDALYAITESDFIAHATRYDSREALASALKDSEKALKEEN